MSSSPARGIEKVTIENIIDAVDALKPNPYTDAQKTAWLSRCEGQILTECYLMPIEDVPVYDCSTDSGIVPLVPPPYDKLYESYICAMIDYANGEYNKYQNTMQMFNRDMSDFVRWLTRLYEPARRVKHNVKLGGIDCGTTGAVLLDILPEGTYLFFLTCGVTTAFNSGVSDTITLRDEDGNTLISVNGQTEGITRRAARLFGLKGLYAQNDSEGNPPTEGRAVFRAHYFRQEPERGRWA